MVKIKVLAELHSFWRLKGETLPLPFPASKSTCFLWLVHHPPSSCNITLTTASITIFSLLLLSQSLPYYDPRAFPFCMDLDDYIGPIQIIHNSLPI